jgi:Ca-activated chloride channel family protein
MPHIGFGAVQLLPVAALAAVVAGLYAWVFVRRRRAEARYRGASTLPLHARSTSRGRQLTKAGLVVAAVLLLGLAAARPQVGSHHTLLQREGTDVIIALDVSLSMSAQDVKPSRLERAKGAISALLDHLQGDRIGLVTFAGSADLRFPLTTDNEVARKVVQSVTFKDGGLRAGTSISEALRETTTGFANDQTRSKIVLLVSDGEDLGDDAAGAASFVRSQGIALNTIGVGFSQPVSLNVVNPRTGQPEPRLDPNTRQPLTTTADPQALRQLASDNRGRFYDGNTDDFAVQLSDEIGRLQKTRFESGQGNVPNEWFQWLLGLALLLLLIEFLLPAGRSFRRFPRPRRGPRAVASPATPAHRGGTAGEPSLGGVP